MIYYCCANNINIGDYISMLGIKELINISGKELFLERNKALDLELKNINSNDSIIIGGGGLLKDYFEKYWLEILKYKKMNNFKLYIFGVGVCQHKNVDKNTVLKQSLVENIINSSEATYFRAPLPFHNDKVKETFCPSIYHIFKNYKKQENVEKKLLYVSHESLVGKSNDLKIIEILKKYSEVNNLKYSQVNNIARDSSQVESTIDEYNKASLVVSTRLHGYIIATALGKKVLAISKDYKIDGFAKSINDENPLDIKDIDYEKISMKINDKKIISDKKINDIVNDLIQKSTIIKNKIRAG
jgi:polysaccharide pyruvyl transferase WcaK-like protein